MALLGGDHLFTTTCIPTYNTWHTSVIRYLEAAVGILKVYTAYCVHRYMQVYYVYVVR